jgi:hypothetical protein
MNVHLVGYETFHGLYLLLENSWWTVLHGTDYHIQLKCTVISIFIHSWYRNLCHCRFSLLHMFVLQNSTNFVLQASVSVKYCVAAYCNR